MVPRIVAALIVTLAGFAPALRAQPPGAVCAPASLDALREAAALVDDGETRAAEARLRAARDLDPGCRAVAVGFWATLGLLSASHAATRGGPPDLLEPVKDVVTALEALVQEEGRTSGAEYARAAVLAAQAAAQDERDEMRVWLTHARGVSARVEAFGDPPRWPAPFDLLEGALWFEVDRFAEAAEGYERAAARQESVAAWMGLARSRERLGRHDGACAAWGAALALAETRRPDGTALADVRAALAGCGR